MDKRIWVFVAGWLIGFAGAVSALKPLARLFGACP